MQSFQLCAFADEADSALSGQIEAMKENQIPFLEIRRVGGKNISKVSCDEAMEIKKELDAHNIRVWSIGSPTGKVSIKEPFAPHLQEFCHMLDLAKILGATHYRLFSFFDTDGDVSYEPEVIERLACMVEKATGQDIVLCHENEKDIYGDTAARCLCIHQALPSIKAIFDPANFIQCDEDVPAAWNMLKPYVEYIHVKDALENGQVVPAGNGIGHIPMILADMKEKGCTLSLEPHLSRFVGLEDLERGSVDHVSFSYPTQRAAFDGAADALKKVLQEVVG